MLDKFLTLSMVVFWYIGLPIAFTIVDGMSGFVGCVFILWVCNFIFDVIEIFKSEDN